MEVEHLSDPEQFFASEGDFQGAPVSAMQANMSKEHDSCRKDGTHDYSGQGNSTKPRSPFAHFIVSTLLAPVHQLAPGFVPEASILSDYLYTFPARLQSPSAFLAHILSSWLIVLHWIAHAVCARVYSVLPESMQLSREEFAGLLRTCGQALGGFTVLGVLSGILQTAGGLSYLMSYYVLLPPAPSTVPLHFDYSVASPQGIVFQSPMPALASQLIQNNVFSRTNLPAHCASQSSVEPTVMDGATEDPNYMYLRERASVPKTSECTAYVHSNIAPPHSRSPATPQQSSAVHNYDQLLHLTVPQFPYFSPFARQFSSNALHEASVLTAQSSLLSFNERDRSVQKQTDTTFTFSPFAPVQAHPTSVRSLDGSPSPQEYGAGALSDVDEGLQACAARGCYDDRFDQPSTLARVFAWLVYRLYTSLPARFVRYCQAWWVSAFQLVTAPFSISAAVQRHLLSYFLVTQDVRTHTFPLLVNLPSEIPAHALAVSIAGPHSRDLNILDARVSVVARVTGVRWLMQYWPITSFIVGSVVYAWIWGCIVLFLFYKVYASYEKSQNDYIEHLFGARQDEHPLQSTDKPTNTDYENEYDEDYDDCMQASANDQFNRHKESHIVTPDGDDSTISEILLSKKEIPPSPRHRNKQPNLLTFSSLQEDPTRSVKNLWHRFRQATWAQKLKTD